MLAFAALTVIALLFLAYEAKAAPLVPDPPFKGRFDSVEASADARPFFAVDPSFHEASNAR